MFDLFIELVVEFAPPQSKLTDNGRVFTARFGNGRNQFEYKLAGLGIMQKNSSPNHPKTQGKIERFHQTLKLNRSKKPRATTLGCCSNSCTTQMIAVTPTDLKACSMALLPHASIARPQETAQDLSPFNLTRARYDRVNPIAKATLRRAGKLHHIGIGRAHAGAQVTILTTKTHVTVLNPATREQLSDNLIDARKNYWRNEMNPRKV